MLSTDINFSYIIGPGDIILDEMESMQLTEKELMERTALSLHTIKGLLSNSISINEDIAKRLSIVFKTSEQFWLNLETNYRERLSKKTNKHHLYKHSVYKREFL